MFILNKKFIYIKTNRDWDYEEKYKYGVTQDLYKRLNDFKESSSYKFNYAYIFEIIKIEPIYFTRFNYKSIDKIFSILLRKNINKIKDLPNLIEIKKYLVNNDNTAGEEFIYKSGIELFIKILLEDFKLIGLIIKQLDINDVNNINYIIHYYNYHSLNYQNINDDINDIDDNDDNDDNNDINDNDDNDDNKIKPFDYQEQILMNINNFYIKNNIGKIIHSCGLGKTITAIFIIKKLGFRLNLIGVPSIQLKEQFGEEIKKIIDNSIIIYVNNNITFIKDYIKKLKINEILFIITTYHSCYKLKSIQFDFKIGDEAHHLVGLDNNDESTKFIEFHKIISKKTLFMTATEKIINNSLNEVYSMDNVNQFGTLIDEKTIKWAIDNKKITDYNLCLIKNTKDDLLFIIRKLEIDENYINLFMSAYMVLKMFEKIEMKISHTLIYTNTIDSANIIKKYIDIIISKNIITGITPNNIYNKSLHSKNCTNINNEIDEFIKSPYSIINCVYLFGEGFNLPKLNSVCIAETMTSEIRITQYALRPNRLDSNNPNKKAVIMLPYIDDENDFNMKIKRVITDIGLSDECIKQRIQLLNFKENNKKEILNNPIISKNLNNFDLIEDNGELMKIKFKLKSRLFYKEQDIYNDMIKLNKLFNYKSKADYYNSKTIHQNFMENPKEYFDKYGLWKSWYEFLSINTDNIIKTKEDWKKRCIQLKITSIEDYYKKQKENEELPEIPEEFYINFSNIQNELELFKKRR
jgi:superfamily II DNA or RNA helicase